MRILVTAGPTREYIDIVRFITNASSGQMGCAIATAAAQAGHEVTLLIGPAASMATGVVPDSTEVVPFTTGDDLKAALGERFDTCDVLIMAAAVGDFRPEKTHLRKLPRSGGPVTLRLIPTEDILAGLGRRKRDDQIIIAFAVEDAPDERIEAGAREKMAGKNADYIVVNTPAAMAAEQSHACILSPDGVVLPWAGRSKHQLAEEIVRLLG